MDVHRIAEDIRLTAIHIENNIIGRVANKIGDTRYNSLETLMRYVVASGDGNHIEIGTLFGGSAIAVALMKKEYGLRGLVFCVDPLDGYYQQYSPNPEMIDQQSGIPVTPETLFVNLEKFGVSDKVCVLRSKSTDIEPFTDISFETAYIDGDHRGSVPYFDFTRVSLHTKRFVLFDNYDEYHPDVVSACDEVSKFIDWMHVETSGITYVLERIK